MGGAEPVGQPRTTGPVCGGFAVRLGELGQTTRIARRCATRSDRLPFGGMHTIISELVPLAADVQARGGIIAGIGKVLLVGIVILVLLGVFIGMKVARRKR